VELLASLMPVCAVAGSPGASSKKKLTGTFENGRNVLQTAGADAVGALFIFLDLLEGDAQRFAQLFLTHAEHGPAKPDPAADMDVDRIGFFLFTIILSS
jgi:hypothetical protein